SVQHRALFMQNGGHVVVHIIAIWSAFLPLGDRFSIDALLRSLRGRREATPGELRERRWTALFPLERRHLAYFFICANFAFIYWFNAIHKGGGTWREGSAVHYLLWQNRIATSFAGFLRMHEPFWLSPALTWGTLFIEFSLPFLILSPWQQRWTRPVAIFFIIGLHGSIAAMSTLGPFSYAMISFSLVLVPTETWEWLAARRRKTARVV